MSEKINLTELRATHDGMGGTVRVNQGDLLALVEAVEAAHALMLAPAENVAALDLASYKLRQAHLRFEFGQDR